METGPDYYIVISETGERLCPWGWEIRRHSKPMGVKIAADGHQSKTAAEYAGKMALARFLEALVMEERRSGPGVKR
jgi:hypothetical protein